ncbi:GAF domain/diguanylate cyclase [Klebsiella pneumoniae subsp. rhinoscleromatis]|nr:GAF domain/diguanylate cyclase [Klebsiella pneumoniae subsp. rhinoscleromatis]
MTFGVLELYYSCQFLFLPGVSQTLAAEQSLETLVRQLLEMLEAVTRMESTYLTPH